MIKETLEQEIAHITRQIVEKFHPEKIILFGSAARRDATHVHDLDFLIIKRDLPNNGGGRARRVRKAIVKRVAADFLVYRPEEIQERTRLGDPFVLSILRHGRVLHG
ncbi:MAG: nucleotidyltransferase domain-containing protein [Deltaproteobacteria bacterium]|nr:nucleotidyltransferase domain-containing protein [Deltaproteobacteria bacterium]